MKYKILDLSKGEESLPLLMEYMNYKTKDKKETYTISTFLSSLKFNYIFAKTPDDVLPFILDNNYFICASTGQSETIVNDTLAFLNEHPDFSNLKKITKEGEFTGKYLNVPRLLIDYVPYVSTV